jgi:hypothetical protein
MHGILAQGYASGGAAYRCDKYGSSRTLDCVSAPLVDKMLVCLPRMGFPDAERQSILSFRDRASGKLSLHDTDGMWVHNVYVIHFGS